MVEFQSAVHFPSIPSPGIGVEEGVRAAGKEGDVGGALVAYQAVVQHVDINDDGGQALQIQPVAGHRHDHRSGSPGREAMPLGRVFDYWECRGGG